MRPAHPAINILNISTLSTLKIFHWMKNESWAKKCESQEKSSKVHRNWKIFFLSFSFLITFHFCFTLKRETFYYILSPHETFFPASSFHAFSAIVELFFSFLANKSRAIYKDSISLSWWPLRKKSARLQLIHSR